MPDADSPRDGILTSSAGSEWPGFRDRGFGRILCRADAIRHRRIGTQGVLAPGRRPRWHPRRRLPYRPSGYAPDLAPAGSISASISLVIWSGRTRSDDHANGTVGIERTLIASDDPSRLGALFLSEPSARLPCCRVPGGIERSSWASPEPRRARPRRRLRHPRKRRAQRCGAHRVYGRADLYARCSAHAQAEAALSLQRDGTRLVVPATAAFGCTLEFVE